MPPWLLIWIGRWASGERFRKATSEDYRLHFGSCFFMGLMMMIGFMPFCKNFLEHAGGFTIWICATILIIILLFVSFVWARFVPAAVSLALALITWGVFVWMALRKTNVL